MKLVSDKFIKKNIKLSLEFDDYLAKHPELYDSIPNGAVIVFTVKRDEKFSKDSIAIVKKHHSKEPVVKAEKYRSGWEVSPLELSPA